MTNKTKTIAFVGSNSSKSINKQLTLSLIKDKAIDFVDIQNWNIPMYSEDIQRIDGFPVLIDQLANEIHAANKIIISVGEHNSCVSAFMKNILDWLSRHSKKIFHDKSVFVLSTSNGQRGALSANEYTTAFCSRNGALTTQAITFPVFSEHFDIEKQTISKPEIKFEIETIISNFINS